MQMRIFKRESGYCHAIVMIALAKAKLFQAFYISLIL